MSAFIHGDNIETKRRSEKGDTNLRYLDEIKPRYDKWLQEIDKLSQDRSKSSIVQMVKNLNAYKDFIDQPKFRKEKGNPHGFTSQSKLHSTVLEEFMYHLLAPIPSLRGKHLEYGPTNAYSNLYFAPRSLDAFEKDSGLTVNTKDQDFAISKKIRLHTILQEGTKPEQQDINVPIVSIECKTYLDKTMYEGSVATAEKIKKGNPYSLFLIVTETYEVASSVDPAYSEIDQIYVLRKQSQREARQPIQADIVLDLYEHVRRHLAGEWRDVAARIRSGKLI